MGKRSRKRPAAPRQGEGPIAPRAGGPTTPARPAAPVADPRPSAPAAPPPVGRRAAMADAPPAPWSPFPLVELTILAGIVLLVLGFLGVGGERVSFVVCGLALVTVASLELSLREHFAGYRSHSALLAGAATVLVVVVAGVVAHPPGAALVAAGAVVFAACLLGLRRAFARRTGGIGFRA
jgi:hypothetical protein